MTISLRNLPKDVEEAILETSKRENISRNKATLKLLEASVRKPEAHTHKRELNHDFDKYFGSVSKEEADEFDAVLAEMRKVDPIDWEPYE